MGKPLRQGMVSLRQRRVVFIVLLTAATTCIGAALFNSASYHVGPFTLRLQWGPSFYGISQLHFPPLGDVRARTHRSPVRLSIHLEHIDFTALRALDFETGDLPSAAEPFVDQLLRTTQRFFVRMMVIGAVVGLMAGVLASFQPRRDRAGPIAVGTGVGLMTLGLISALTWVTFDVQAFRAPVYRGALTSIPLLIDTVEEGIARTAVLEERLAVMSKNLFRMYDQLEQLGPPLAHEEADVRILHVTDFHNHPAAGRVTREIARAFDVDFIINTGDLTEFGTFLEAELLDTLRDMPVPHYFVSGNHESPDLMDRIALMDDMILLDGREVMDSGVRILGVGDPGAASHLAPSLTAAESRRIADQLNEGLRRMAEPPDVIAVHNFRVAEHIEAGLVPLVVYGHSHTPAVTFRGGTAYVNAGTTGGAGLRGIEVPEPVRISLAVVYFQRSGHRAGVTAVDLIRLSPIGGGFVLERLLAPVMDL